MTKKTGKNVDIQEKRFAQAVCYNCPEAYGFFFSVFILPLNLHSSKKKKCVDSMNSAVVFHFKGVRGRLVINPGFTKEKKMYKAMGSVCSISCTHPLHKRLAH